LDTQSIISELEAERDRLDQAISALKGGGRRLSKGGPSGMGVRRRLSAAARKRISDAQKKRWAAQKKTRIAWIHNGYPIRRRTTAPSQNWWIGGSRCWSERRL